MCCYCNTLSKDPSIRHLVFWSIEYHLDIPLFPFARLVHKELLALPKLASMQLVIISKIKLIQLISCNKEYNQGYDIIEHSWHLDINLAKM